jgi:hypothetical protein
MFNQVRNYLTEKKFGNAAINSRNIELEHSFTDVDPSKTFREKGFRISRVVGGARITTLD